MRERERERETLGEEEEEDKEEEEEGQGDDRLVRWQGRQAQKLAHSSCCVGDKDPIRSCSTKELFMTHMKRCMEECPNSRSISFMHGLITGDDETAYRKEVRALTSWCQDNNLQLNVSKTKELIVDFRRRQREEHAPLSINGTTVERVNSFRFLGVHISEDLTWTHHTDFVTKVSHGKQVLGDGNQTKSGSQAHHEQKNIKDRYVARIGVTGAPPWSQAWGWGLQAKRLVAGSLPTGPGQAQPEMATWARLPVRLTTHGGRSMRGRCNVVWVAVVAGASTTQSLDQNSGNRDMECHLAGGKEPELVPGG
ncbi:hypothetical protein L3Q82_007354 [Scortum barcoo]|uniref:Uncharacterized protein n=1 Tax=Scortum barcoo TaxID=214431 RepID=A0ACB8WTR8_9TELE|nr:hypothetical protein L3Q82_007354 [Scortum barcoo]